ncbi:putative carotenoid ester lipase precursor protein [Ilyonectria robusta]
MLLSVLSELSQLSPYKPSTSSRLVLLGLVNCLIPIIKLSLLILLCGGAAALNVRYSCLSGSKAPYISLDYGTFRGTSNFTGVNSFLGLPFAKAGRYENPRVLDARDHQKGVRDATKYGLECPQ